MRGADTRRSPVFAAPGSVRGRGRVAPLSDGARGDSRPPAPDERRPMSTEEPSTVARVDVEGIEREATAAVEAAATPAELEDARVRFLGRKSDLKLALRQVRDRESGMALNDARERLEAAFAAREAALDRAELERRLTQERVDVTLPGERVRRGRLHPITQVRRIVEDAFL